MATAASVEGATEPTASPSEADVKDSSVRMPRNAANLHRNMLPDPPTSRSVEALQLPPLHHASTIRPGVADEATAGAG